MGEHAQALGWDEHDLVGFPRRNDRDDGGEYRARDLRPASHPAFNLTEKSRSWTRRPTHLNPRQVSAAPRPVEYPAPTLTAVGLGAGVAVWDHDAGDIRDGKAVSPDAIRVSETEASVLQSFRPDYPWQGSRSKQFHQIGNAVPPALGAAVLANLVPVALEVAA